LKGGFFRFWVFVVFELLSRVDTRSE
jgi:hypothetical protein